MAIVTAPTWPATDSSVRRNLLETGQIQSSRLSRRTAVAHGPPSRRRRPRPGLERPDKRAGLGETEFGGDLADAPVLKQEVLRGVEPHFIGEAREGDSERLEAMG